MNFRDRLVRAAAITALMAPMLFPAGAGATEDEDLLAACGASGEASSACRHYVAGFLDGALLTDTAIIDSLAVESEFLARAYRTRVGEMRMPPPATALAEFCLPAGMRIDDAAREIVDALADHAGPATSLQEAVYAAVKKRFPCETL